MGCIFNDVFFPFLFAVAAIGCGSGRRFIGGRRCGSENLLAGLSNRVELLTALGMRLSLEEPFLKARIIDGGVHGVS